MGKILKCSPPPMTGDAEKDLTAMWRYLHQLTEQVDYQLVLMKKQTPSQEEESQ